jgi:hypothetical protein
LVLVVVRETGVVEQAGLDSTPVLINHSYVFIIKYEGVESRLDTSVDSTPIYIYLKKMGVSNQDYVESRLVCSSSGKCQRGAVV